jgi:hypothetical protein
MNRSLLRHPYENHLSKVVFRNLETRSRTIVSLCLSDIYNYAAERIYLCDEMEPKAFFACTKNVLAWSAKFRDDAFWALTYKLFYARALYMETVPPNKRPEYGGLTGGALVKALDRFHNIFNDYYSDKAVHGK